MEVLLLAAFAGDCKSQEFFWRWTSGGGDWRVRGGHVRAYWEDPNNGGFFSFFFLADSPETMTVVGLESTILGVVTWNRLHNTLLSIVPEQVLFIRVPRYIDLVAVSDFTDHLQRGHTEYFGVHYRNRKV